MGKGCDKNHVVDKYGQYRLKAECLKFWLMTIERPREKM